MSHHRISRPEKGYDLEHEGDRLVLHVLCGTVGLYEIRVVLDDEQRRQFEQLGEVYLDQLAKDVQRDPRHYSGRDDAT